MGIQICMCSLHTRTFVMRYEQELPGVLAEAKLVVESIRADRQP